jgi:uncharacterized membrane-anchored protein
VLNIIKKYYVWALLLAAVIAQLGFPLRSIMEKNDVLKTGAEYKINRVRPIDPADPFRGRYVAISVGVAIPEDWENKRPGGVYYIRLAAGEDGFAEVAEVSNTPIEGDGVLKLDSGWREWDNTIQLPFDRYYMREEIAPKAENAYREDLNIYVKLRVKNRQGVIAGLYVEDTRIEEYVGR